MSTGKEPINKPIMFRSEALGSWHYSYKSIGEISEIRLNGKSYRPIVKQSETCQFCGESGFDLAGLKGHLKNEDCEQFRNVEQPKKVILICPTTTSQTALRSAKSKATKSSVSTVKSSARKNEGSNCGKSM